MDSVGRSKYEIAFYFTVATQVLPLLHSPELLPSRRTAVDSENKGV